jgi:hypothetical protein
VKKLLSADAHAGQPVERRFVGDATYIASRAALPGLRYTLTDFNKNWRGRLTQMIIDHSHKGGD